MFVFSLSLYLMYVYIMFDDEELIVFKSYYEIKFCSVPFIKFSYNNIFKGILGPNFIF